MIEALYIFDEHNSAILEHVYSGRPASAATLLRQYLSHPAPRPAVISVPNSFPTVVLHSLVHDRLLFLCPTSPDAEPLVALEFLYRVADALDEFLGAPLLASKLEASYDVVAQLVGELCDAGTISTTEPDALKEVVEAPTWTNNLLSGLGLPLASPALTARSSSPGAPFLSQSNTNTASSVSAIPWRRSNVRHTSNELYVDIVEQLSVILAPSGRPLSALSYGTIAFTAKISGIPDLMLSLSAPGGRPGIENSMSLPTFHPCVRLNRWRDRPGDISFVPPDGRFVLAGFECNLLPDLFTSANVQEPKLDLPVAVEMRTGVGASGDEIEVGLTLNRQIKSSSANPSLSGSSFGSRAAAALATNSRLGGALGNTGSGATQTSNAAAIEDIVVKIPLSAAVRNANDIRASKGEAHFLPNELSIEWRIPTREAATITPSGALLRCTIVGPADSNDDKATNGLSLKSDTFDYDETVDDATSYQRSQSLSQEKQTSLNGADKQEEHAKTKMKSIMPRSASISFCVRGWLPSGIKVEALTVNTKTSKGLGAGVTPYKGVKYHTISRGGVEIRS